MTYADTAPRWLAAGFGPLPLPAGQKYPPPTGWTGKDTAMPSAADVAAWSEEHAAGNVALRLPPHVVALDVDAYDGRPGWSTLLAAVGRRGALPPTHRISPRDDGQSGHYLYRLPAGTTDDGFGGELAGGGVDVLRHGHRYSVAPGSLHPSGATYRLYAPDGTQVAGVVRVDELPELPACWVDELRRPALAATAPVYADEVPARLELSEAECRRLDAYTRRIVEQETARLDACTAAATPAGRDYRGPAWNATTFAVSCSLLQLANSPWSTLTEQRVLELVQGHAPRDAGFTAGDVEKAFRSARQTVGTKARSLPVDRTPPTTDGRVDPFEDPTGGVAAAVPVRRVATSGRRPALDVSNDAVVADYLAACLGTGPTAGVFVRGGELVRTPRVGEDGYLPPDGEADHDGPAQVRPQTPGALASWLSLLFECTRTGRDGIARPALFPRAAAQVAVEAPDMQRGVRRLRGVTHTPTVRADGTILDRPGFDDASGLLYLPEPGLIVPAVPEAPTREDVGRAVSLLAEMLAGFRFVSDHDRANWLGLALTPVLRLLAPPPYKLGAIGAPQPGSGKTLLASILRTLHGGVFRSEFPADDGELRKSVSAILDVTTAPVVHFDNLTGVLRSSTLAGLLTGARWDDRRLGATAMLSAPNDRLWVVTGNNLALGGDLVRRTVHVTIDPGVPDPHLRTDFRIADLEGWVRARRGVLLAALLTLVRAWVVAGRPVRGARSSDGFAHWVEAVDGILWHAGEPGRFDDASAAPEPVGRDDDEWAGLLRAVHAHFGSRPWTARELLSLIDTGTTGIADQARPLSVDLLPSELTEKLARSHAGPTSLTKSLGMWLRNRAGRWADGFTVRQAGRDRKDSTLWRVDAHATAAVGQVGVA